MAPVVYIIAYIVCLSITVFCLRMARNAKRGVFQARKRAKIAIKEKNIEQSYHETTIKRNRLLRSEQRDLRRELLTYKAMLREYATKAVENMIKEEDHEQCETNQLDDLIM